MPLTFSCTLYPFIKNCALLLLLDACHTSVDKDVVAVDVAPEVANEPEPEPQPVEEVHEEMHEQGMWNVYSFILPKLYFT